MIDAAHTPSTTILGNRNDTFCGFLISSSIRSLLSSPGHHLGPVDALRLADDAHGVLWVFEVVQQHADHVVPVSGALVGLRRLFVPGAKRQDDTLKYSVASFCLFVYGASESGNVLAIGLLGLGVLQVDLGRGDVRQQLSHLRPEPGATMRRS